MNIKKICIILFAYIAHIQSFTVTQVPGSPFPTGAGPLSAAFTPLLPGDILFAATANTSDNTITVFQVNTSTGAFTPVSGSPFAGDNAPNKIAFSPIVNNNLFAAVSNDTSGLISVYSVNTTTGFFTPVAGSPFFAGSGISSVTFSPVISGNLFLAVVNQTGNTISSFAVNTSTGFLTQAPGSPFVSGLSPIGIAFSPNFNGNLFAAVTNGGTSSTSIFSVSPTTGAFTEVAGSPFATPVSFGVAFSPLTNGNNNLFLILGNNLGSTTSVYSVQNNTGTLTPVPNSPFATGGLTAYGTAFSDIAFNTLFAAVSNQSSNNVSLYTTNQTTGELTPLNNSPFATGNTPRLLNFSPALSTQLLVAIPNVLSNDITVYSIKAPPPVLVSAVLNCTTGLVTVTGTQAIANSMIQAFADGTTFIGNGVTDNLGNFTFETTTPISITTHIITVEQPANPGEVSNGITVSCAPPVPENNFLASALTRAIVNKYCPARARFFI